MSNKFLKLKCVLTTLFALSFVGCADDFKPVHPTSYGITTVAVTEDTQLIETESPANNGISEYFDLSDVPEFSVEPSCVVNFNMPFFLESELTSSSFEKYSPLDDLGRCGPAIACLSTETMPADGEIRGKIGEVRPSGWHTVKYPDFIKDNYLYNRCHLIGWQLSAENANPNNLVTGTRYMNVDGMLPYENKVADYIHETDHHVMYRVTPVFVDSELVCRGVLIEAKSIEDSDCVFCVYCYNNQPAIKIDYLTGESCRDDDYVGYIPDMSGAVVAEHIYILNTKTKKIHDPKCPAVESMSDYNKSTYNGEISVLIDQGYSACKTCNPD